MTGKMTGTMTETGWDDLGDNIYCIDTGYQRAKMAACYLVREGDAVAILDTGTNFTLPRIMALLASLDLGPENVQYIIPTHVHLDHAGGAGLLMQQCPNATLVIHPKGAQHMIDPSRLAAGAAAVYGADAFARDYGTLVPVPAERVVIAQDQHRVSLNGRELIFYDTPGHANHHGCILDTRTRAIVCGDTFGLCYRELVTDKGDFILAPTTPVAFDPQRWHDSIDRLISLKPTAMLLTHYGRVTDIAKLAQQLHLNIDMVAAIALSQEEVTEHRQQHIKDGLSQATLSAMKAHGIEMSETEMAEFLAIDLDLNAQGLEVWLQRRTSRPAA